MTVPFVEGDLDGQLTSVLTQEISESGLLSTCERDGELSLHVKILGFKNEDIGYDRFYNKENDIQRWMVPNERRLSILVKISVVDEETQKVILGPADLSTSVTYNFDPEYSVDNLVGFSLGQFNFSENAQDIAETPLNQQIAKQIVDYVVDGW